MSFFDRDEYLESADPFGYENSLDDLTRKKYFLTYLPKDDFSKVLDIGVGTGFITRDLNFNQFIGIDISPTAISILNRHFQNLGKEKTHKGIEMSILNSDVEKLGVFDLVIITGVLYQHYIGENRNLVLDNILKVTEKGSVIVSVHISDWKPFTLDANFVELDRWFYPYRSFVHEISVMKRIK